MNKTMGLFFTEKESGNSHRQETNVSHSRSFFTPVLSKQVQGGENCDLKSNANKSFNHSNQTRGLLPWLQEVKVLIPGHKKSTGGRLQALLPPPEQFSQYFPFSGSFHLENIFFFFLFWKANSFVNYSSKHEYFSNSGLSITIKMLL